MYRYCPFNSFFAGLILTRVVWNSVHTVSTDLFLKLWLLNTEMNVEMNINFNNALSICLTKIICNDIVFCVASSTTPMVSWFNLSSTSQSVPSLQFPSVTPTSEEFPSGYGQHFWFVLTAWQWEEDCFLMHGVTWTMDRFN